MPLFWASWAEEIEAPLVDWFVVVLELFVGLVELEVVGEVESE